MALKLLALPREVGLHPESAKPIIAGFGRYGPYVAHDGAYASLESPEDVFTVGLNRAVTLIAERKEKGGRPRGAQADAGASGEVVDVPHAGLRNGRRGHRQRGSFRGEPPEHGSGQGHRDVFAVRAPHAAIFWQGARRVHPAR